MPVVAKKKPRRVPISEKVLWKAADKSLKEFQASSEERYAQAMKVYDAQSPNTQDALDRMIDLLSGIARRKMWVGVRGRQDERVVMTLPDQVIKQNMTYMAVEILLDLAQMDVQVEDFKMPANLCAVCKNEIKPAKKKRRKK